MNRLSFIAAFFVALFLFSCSGTQQEAEQKAQWQFSKEIPLKGFSPIGIVAQGDFLWLSDVDNNRIVKINLDGEIIEEYSGFERPMHIDIQNSAIYIPEYTSDKIRILKNGNISTYNLLEKADAIGGVAVDGNKVAVADFYNHRIILQENKNVTIIGQEGHNEGELYYPTDVEIEGDLIYVADAYNNRIQVFDKQGKSLKIIGDKDNISVATGLTVTTDNIFVTDFEGNRILIFDFKGNLIQVLIEYLNKPTDIYIDNDTMYVVNYQSYSISVFIIK